MNVTSLRSLQFTRFFTLSTIEYGSELTGPGFSSELLLALNFRLLGDPSKSDIFSYFNSDGLSELDTPDIRTSMQIHRTLKARTTKRRNKLLTKQCLLDSVWIRQESSDSRRWHNKSFVYNFLSDENFFQWRWRGPSIQNFKVLRTLSFSFECFPWLDSSRMHWISNENFQSNFETDGLRLVTFCNEHQPSVIRTHYLPLDYLWKRLRSKIGYSKN